MSDQNEPVKIYGGHNVSSSKVIDFAVHRDRLVLAHSSGIRTQGITVYNLVANTKFYLSCCCNIFSSLWIYSRSNM
jgi:hypothetical protein